MTGERCLNRVSVIIPTKNRKEDLERTVDTLLGQTVKPFELILADQSATPSFNKEIPIPVLYLHNPSISGASEARNVAMEHARGDVWLFLDDDVLLEPDFIEAILKCYEHDVAGVSGIITNYTVRPLRQRVWEKVFQKGPFKDERQQIYRKCKEYREITSIPVRFFGGGLMSFRAAVIREHRFDTNLTGPSPGEDVDFCMRLPKGSILLITPRARLVHNRSPENRDNAHWLSVQAQVSSYLWKRHWSKGIWNNLCFLWLNTGYLVVALYSLLRTGSSEAWFAWRRGVVIGKNLAESGT